MIEKNIAITCNPFAKHHRVKEVAAKLELLLEQMNISHQFFWQQWPQHFDNFSDVWIIGGDGTLNFFINQYPDISLPLSIFPGGSGNDFRWMLYGNLSIEEQFQLALVKEPGRVDVGSCNGKLFLNGIGIGFDGAIVKDLLGKRMLPGKASYLLSILKHIAWFSEKECVIEYNNQQLHQHCFMISVANGKRYGGGFIVAPKAQITDGKLDLNLVGRIAPLKRIRYLPVIEKGKHLNLPFIHYHQSSSIFIRSFQMLHAHRDGEYFSSHQFHIQSIPARFSFRW